MAQCDLHHFEWWALSLVDARPAQDKRKGAARNVHGYLFLVDYDSREPKKVVLRVKSCAVSVLSQVRDLRGAMEYEEEAVGVLVTLESSTEPLGREPLPAGFYKPLRSPGCCCLWLLILTSVELLTASRMHCTWPALVAMFRRPECDCKRRVCRVRSGRGGIAMLPASGVLPELLYNPYRMGAFDELSFKHCSRRNLGPAASPAHHPRCWPAESLSRVCRLHLAARAGWVGRA